MRTPLGKAVRCGFVDTTEMPGWPTGYWVVWMHANKDQTAGTYYRLYIDGRFECWHLNIDGTEQRLDGG